MTSVCPTQHGASSPVTKDHRLSLLGHAPERRVSALSPQWDPLCFGDAGAWTVLAHVRCRWPGTGTNWHFGGWGGPPAAGVSCAGVSCCAMWGRPTVSYRRCAVGYPTNLGCLASASSGEKNHDVYNPLYGFVLFWGGSGLRRAHSLHTRETYPET